MLRYIFTFLCLIFCQILAAQNEFITIWKPSNPSTTIFSAPSSTVNQIWFPGSGDNFNVSWEEIGFPAHNDSFTITSADHFLIDFGAPFNSNPGNATYKVKISNGNGNFHNVKFPNEAFISPSLRIPTIVSYNGDAKKILEVSQWGNIHWTNMEWGFSDCINLDITATDIPDFSSVTSMLAMFYNCTSLIGNPTFNLWNTASVNNMSHLFASAGNFNQPVGNWNVSNVINMDWMFHYLPKFNQPIGNWDTSKVTSMTHMLHICSEFNQDITDWDTSKVTDMRCILEDATAFNYSLGKWNLSLLSMAARMITGSGIDCSNYGNTLEGWANNPATPSGINLYSVAPLVYSSSSSLVARNYLLNNKGWLMSGDNYIMECEQLLSTSEGSVKNPIGIYPNPATDIIYLKNMKGTDYIIFDSAGRIILQHTLNENKIDVSSLIKGNYMLQIITENKRQNFKFIKQ
ncbi:BspA family leucine-rich repeat surface protein [Chryseobacterium cheonjiense]|uniref:BspA family leucine-rich repeat surface protein n=1 Tax=Chryseobacterium cheonjiense TaxID=2728845 RepID=A0A7Y0A9V8_9FLAO|nr:BspA family leucine-rich repeat surface protein [Chryseobacterium cheonjiense]NML59373.1 BspA family leucine-rich repeat surface protein [Chryseobacterium cheonjiense]